VLKVLKRIGDQSGHVNPVNSSLNKLAVSQSLC